MQILQALEGYSSRRRGRHKLASKLKLLSLIGVRVLRTQMFCVRHPILELRALDAER
jgi:hypothetical protein